MLKKEFDIDYHPNSLGAVLDQIGDSIQKPLPRAAERDEELMKAWLVEYRPGIKKVLRLGAIMVFFDEFGLS